MEFLPTVETIILGMVDEWLLEHLAKVSALSCVLIVLYFLIYSIWRITQMPNNPWNWNEWQWPLGGRHAVEIYRKPAEMPFTLSMIDRHKEDIGKSVFNLLFAKDKIPPQITVLWCPSVSYLMQLINLPWPELKEALMIDSLGEGEWSCLLNSVSSSTSNASSLNYFIIERLRYQQSSEETETPPAENRTFSHNRSHHSSELVVSPPVGLDWNLLSNQYRYPAAIFVTDPAEPCYNENEESSINGIIQVLHIKSETFPKSSAILTQYIKMSNGQTHVLQPLYVIDDHRVEEEEDETTDQNGATTDLPPEPFNDILCSVCQVMPVTRVIIPCRHVCLCSQCFQKVESCPICRGAILYYFRTRQDEVDLESDLNNHTNNNHAPEGLTWWRRVERWNERFSDAMGLIRQH